MRAVLGCDQTDRISRAIELPRAPASESVIGAEGAQEQRRLKQH